ncbi:MAG: leucine-rich repeat domain-containing protein [Promethearchaeota archaeon]
MTNIRNNDYIHCKYIYEDGEIHHDKIFLEHNTLVIQNPGNPDDYDRVFLTGFTTSLPLNTIVLYHFDLENFVVNNPIPQTITALHLINCRFKNLSCVHYLSRLRSFTFTLLARGSYQFSFKNSDYAPFKLLKTLGLSGVLLRRIPNFKGLKNLETLILIDNMIPKIEGLEQFDKLKELHLQNNQIEKIEGLDNLHQLRRLYLYENKISLIENLENLTNIEYLDLDYNIFFNENEYKMPLKKAQSYFGHMKNLVMLNDTLYPDNDFYKFHRNSEVPIDPFIGLPKGPSPRLQRIRERQKRRQERSEKV